MKANHSAPYIGFKNKMLHFSDDIEYVDILYSTIKKEHIPSNGTKLFFNQSPKKHPSISRYSICDDNRLQVIRHLKSSIYSSYIKDSYEELTIYLRGITLEAYKNATVNPGRIIGEHTIKMSSVDILTGISNGTLAQTVIDSMFQSLEAEKSTISLIEKTCSKLGLNISKQCINDAVYYLEIRHKLVHTDGYADEEFKKTHPRLRYTNKNYIDLTYKTILDFRRTLFKLVDEFDSEALNKHIVYPHAKL